MWFCLKMSVATAVVLALFSCFLSYYWHIQLVTAPTHPVYNICPEKVARALQHFHRQPVPDNNKQPGAPADDTLLVSDPAAASGSDDHHS